MLVGFGVDGGDIGDFGNLEVLDEVLQVELDGRRRAFGLDGQAHVRLCKVAFHEQALDAIAVVNGPGSFTGVRVGLAAAKGLCHALDLPLIAISRLAVLAHLADPPAGSRVQALIDAGRGEFYHGEYLNGTCVRESLLTRDQLLAVLSLEPAPIVIACEPAIAESLGALSKFGSGGEATPRFLPEPPAADALPLALRRVHQQDFDDPATLDANYLRRTDAEIFAKPIAATRPTAPGTPPR